MRGIGSAILRMAGALESAAAATWIIIATPICVLLLICWVFLGDSKEHREQNDIDD